MMSDAEEYRGNTRERTYNHMRLREFDITRQCGPYQIPTLKGTDFVPDSLIGFNYALSDKGKHAESGVHFFIDDYQFERIWKEPYRYFDVLRRYSCVLTPDFSLYLDMPLAMKIWNVYRSRLIGQMMQDYGLTVIPTLQYAGIETYHFSFMGIEPGGVVATSTVGVYRDNNARALWRGGMDAAIRQLHPSVVVLYGAEIPYDWGNIRVKRIKSREFAKCSVGRCPARETTGDKAGQGNMITIF